MWTYPKGLNRQYIQPKRKRRFVTIPNRSFEDITDTIIFDQLLTRVIPKSISQTIMFNQTVSVFKNLAINDILVFIQSVHVEVFLDSTTTVSSDCVITRPAILTDQLFFRECVGYELIHISRRIYLDLNQFIIFNSNVIKTTGNIIVRSLSNTIIFSESINSSYRINDNISFFQTLNYSNPDITARSLSQTISFSQTVSSTLKHIKARSLSQTITFSDSNTRSRVRVINRQFNDILIFNVNLLLSTKYNFNILQTIRFYDPYMSIRNPFAAKTYVINPNIDLGQNDDNTSSPDNIVMPVVRVIKTQKLMTFTGHSTITLPLPEWGDSQTSKDILNLRRSMNGKIYTYVKTTDRKLLKYTFKLGRRKSLELKQFINLNFTTPIYINDFDRGELWISKITENPVEFDFENSSRTESGRISVQLQFEGVRLS